MVQQVKIARGREFPQNRVKMRAKQSDVIALKRTSEVLVQDEEPTASPFSLQALPRSRQGTPQTGIW